MVFNLEVEKEIVVRKVKSDLKEFDFVINYYKYLIFIVVNSNE